MKGNSRNNKKTRTLGLALSGGSTLGVAHVGVIKALLEHDITIDFISGTSAGSLVATAYAFGVPITKMEEMIGNLKWSQIAKLNASPLGFKSNQPIQYFIENLIGGKEVIENARIPLSIVATNVVDGMQEVFEEGDVGSAVRASAAIPVYFIPVERDNKLYIDGAISENIPISPLLKKNVDIILAVDLMHGIERKVPKNVFDVVSRGYEIMAEHRDTHIEDKAHIVIRPELKRFDGMKFKDGQAILEEGYRATLARIDDIKKLIHTEEIPKTWLEHVMVFLNQKVF